MRQPGCPRRRHCRRRLRLRRRDEKPTTCSVSAPRRRTFSGWSWPWTAPWAWQCATAAASWRNQKSARASGSPPSPGLPSPGGDARTPPRRRGRRRTPRAPTRRAARRRRRARAARGCGRPAPSVDDAVDVRVRQRRRAATSSAASTFTATGRPSSSAPRSTEPRRPLEEVALRARRVRRVRPVGSDGHPTLRSGSGLGDGLGARSSPTESERSATSDWGARAGRARRFCIA